MTTQQAAILHGPGRLTVEEVEVPPLAGAEVLLRVEACALCGSDVHAYLGRLPRIRFPHVLGHELSGVVCAVGEGVTAVRVGDRVCVENHVHCRTCEPCLEGRINICENARSIGFSLPGGFARYVRIPESSAVPLPDGLSFDVGALIQPLSVAYHAVMARGRVRAGDQVLIVGSGSMGLSALQIAVAAGAEAYLCGTSPNRLELAARLGAAGTLNVREEGAYGRVRELTGGRGVDVAFECAGGDQDVTLRRALGAVKRGGRVVQVGTFAENRATIPANDLEELELDLVGARGHPNAVLPCLRLVRQGRIDPSAVITHRLPLEEAERGLRLLAFERTSCVKVVLHPNGTPVP